MQAQRPDATFMPGSNPGLNRCAVAPGNGHRSAIRTLCLEGQYVERQLSLLVLHGFGFLSLPLD